MFIRKIKKQLFIWPVIEVFYFDVLYGQLEIAAWRRKNKPVYIRKYNLGDFGVDFR